MDHKIALLSHDQLNAILLSHNFPLPATKAEAFDAVRNLINAGDINVTTALNLASQAKAVPKVTGSVPDDVRKTLLDTNDKVTDALARAADAERKARTLAAEVESKAQSLDESFKRLESSLSAKVDQVARPDEARVSAEINAAVGKLFDQFRKDVPVERLAEVAEAVPVVSVSTAADVFGAEATSYQLDGETIDFGSLPVQVWGDVNAPDIVDDYVFNPAHLHQSLIALDDPLPDNVWLAGERGTGKTEFVSQLAARLQRRLFRVNFDEALERADFIGGNTIENSNVVWKPGVITQAIRHPGAIILLDEIGFARAQSLAVLHSLCERSPHRSITIAETGERVRVAPHVVFFGADNSNGHGDSSGNFAGVREQNTAFLDRFSFTLRFEYLPAADETALIAKRTGLSYAATEHLVRFVSVAREKAKAGILTQPPSLRQLFAWARAVKRGVPVRTAFNNAIVNKFPSDCAPELEAVFLSQINLETFKQSL